jgi:hypothetical protein
MVQFYTPHSQDNQDFSNQGHMRARIDIYPLLFSVPGDRISYIELANAKERDYDQGIDKTVRVSVPGLRGKLGFTVQERFRRPKYASNRDITITEFNRNSGMLSELYKIEADLILYGYYNPDTDAFIESIACWVPLLKANIARGTLSRKTELNRRSNQDFLCFKFDELERLPGIVAFHKNWRLAA